MFLASLRSNIATRIEDTATLRNALDVAFFLALSMGHVGTNFYPLLAPLSDPMLIRIVAVCWGDRLDGMVETLKVCRNAASQGRCLAWRILPNQR